MRMQSGARKPVRSGQGMPQKLGSLLDRKLWIAKLFENHTTNRMVELKMRHLPWPPATRKALQALGQ